MAKRVVLTGGGSGGHIYPLLASKEALDKRKPGLEYYYIGPKDEYSAILSEKGIHCYSVASSKLRRYASGILSNILDVPRFIISLFQALFRLYVLMPDVIFSKGGPGAFSVVLAGWFYHVPVVIHDSDAAPGLTNLLSSYFSKTICLSFESAQKYFNPNKIVLTGNPIRKEFFEKYDRTASMEQFGFKSDFPLVLFIGGSQGAQRLNEFVVLNLKEILPLAQVLHQTGKANFSEVEKLSRAELIDAKLDVETSSRYKPVPYFDGNMNIALSACDLVVSRAGSSSIFEIAAQGKASILIPLPEAANDHQQANAEEAEGKGSAIVIEQGNMVPGIFLHQVKNILGNNEIRTRMEKAAAEFAKPQAAADIAENIDYFIK